MPFINVKTNSALANEHKEEIKAELGNAITAIPGKSEDWLMVRIDYSENMYFKGEGSGCAIFEVSIFGSADKRAYDELTRRLCAISEKYLELSASRTYVKYSEIDHWGWNNMNF